MTWMPSSVIALPTRCGSIHADFDNDLDVDGNDFLAWQVGLGIRVNATRGDGDADRDGDVDGDDFLLWQFDFGTGAGARALGSGATALNSSSNRNRRKSRDLRLERLLPKLDVAGSNPVSRSNSFFLNDLRRSNLGRFCP